MSLTSFFRFYSPLDSSGCFQVLVLLMQSSSPKKSEALIAFGANQGDCEAALAKAIQILEDDPAILELKCSRAVRTKAVTGETAADSDQQNEYHQQNEYLNAAIRVLTTLSPDELHQAMIAIEKELGREREQRWGSRTIDLDLLLIGDLQLRSDDLTIPHPRMSFRQFVLQPALDIAANMVHPESGMTLQQLIDHLNSADPIIVIATNDSEFAQTISKNANGNDYQVRIVNTDMEFMSESCGAKLVVAYIDESKMDQETEKLIRFAYNFAGPTLRINPTLGEESATKELCAAIEAMNP